MRSKGKIDWQNAPDIKRRVVRLIKSVELPYPSSRIFTYRSINANTRAYARIWGLSYLWQKVLGVKPAYIVEVISEKFDNLREEQKDEVLLHELAHIPMNFSGALVPHAHGKGRFHDKLKKWKSLFYTGKMK